jgi:hypothetical protein
MVHHCPETPKVRPSKLRDCTGAAASRLLLYIATTGLLVANLVHFLTRPYEASFYPSSYSTMYFPTDRPVVTGWQEVDGGVEAIVNWDAGVEGWKLYLDGAFVSENSGSAIFFPVDKEDSDNRTYTVVAQPEGLHPPFPMKVRYLSRSFHENRGLPRPTLSIVMSDEPMASFKQYPVSHWVDTFDYLSGDELAEVDDILREHSGILESDSTLDKLEKVMIHQRKALNKACRGTPPPQFRWKNPYTIYKEMRDGEGLGWCTQQAQVFVFLANRAGLSTRLVQGARTQNNNFVHTGHTWVEAWIPEQGRWAWVEPSYAIIYATDKELANLRQHAAWEGITGRIYKDWGWPDIEGTTDTLVDAAFADVGGVVERQFITSAIYKWRRPPNVEDLRYDYTMLFKDWTFTRGNFVRYYFKPPLAYANYPTEGARTYWIRHILLWSFLASLLASVFLAVRARQPAG